MLGINELCEACCNACAHRTAIVQKEQKLLIGLRQHTTKLERSPGDNQHRRRVQRRVNLHQMNELLCFKAHVRTLLVSIKEQFHVERSQVAVSKLYER